MRGWGGMQLLCRSQMGIYSHVQMMCVLCIDLCSPCEAVVHHVGRQVQPPTAAPPKHFGPLKRGGGRAGLPGTPTYIHQNEPLVALIILNTHMWVF